MESNNLLIDLSRLKNLKEDLEGFTSQCPVCELNGHDLINKNHLRIYKKTKKFSCIISPGDEQHNSQILQLVGHDSDENFEYEYPKIQHIEIEKIYDKSILDKLVKNYDYWLNRGISLEVMEKTRGGIANTPGQMEDRWIIPIFNEIDEIIGFTGRALKDQKIKWKHLGKTGVWVYGGIKEIKETKKIILVESPGDYFRLCTFGINNVLVLWGVYLSQTLMAKIISLSPQHIYIGTNNDVKHNVGQKAAFKIRNKLSPFFNEGTIEIALPLTKDFGEMSDEQLKEWKEKYKV